MLNTELGTSICEPDGSVCLVTQIGVSGHALFGPYERVEAGRYVVEFHIEDAGLSEDADDSLVARIDVAAEFGRRILAADYVTMADLRARPSARLEFDVEDSAELEYRIFVNGRRPLKIQDNSVARVRNGSAAATGPRWRQSPAEEQAAIRKVLRLLEPHRVVGFDKIRMGNAADGGYVMIDDFEGIDTALSLGINDDIGWDLAIAEHGLKIYQFDHTVTDPAPNDDRMIFSPTMIAAHTREGSVNLEDLANRHHRADGSQNVILKMDIENWEWEAFDTLNKVSVFSQIVCELHYFQGLADPMHRDKVLRCLEKINRHYALVHVHGNIYGGFSHIAGVTFPNVLEVTFANRSRYKVEPTDELFPTPLDASCNPELADFWLGSFKF